LSIGSSHIASFAYQKWPTFVNIDLVNLNSLLHVLLDKNNGEHASFKV